jgi:2-keto-3-deoxy-L-rhamnonate aldolase RhmA
MEVLHDVVKAGKAPGILMTDPVQDQRYQDAGALFVALAWTPCC